MRPIGCGQRPGARDDRLRPRHGALRPVLSWTPSTGTASYAYGTIDAGTQAVQTFTLRNHGGSATSALNVTLTGSSAYSITRTTCSGTSIGPKKTCTVTVQYAPTTAGQTDTATLASAANKPTTRANHTLTGSARSTNRPRWFRATRTRSRKTSRPTQLGP